MISKLYNDNKHIRHCTNQVEEYIQGSMSAESLRNWRIEIIELVGENKTNN